MIRTIRNLFGAMLMSLACGPLAAQSPVASPPADAQDNPVAGKAVLGTVSGQRYSAPEDFFSVMLPEIPAIGDDTSPISIRESLSSTRCTVVFKREDPRAASYRIDLARKPAHLDIPEDLDGFARSSFASYLSLIQRMRNQQPVKIDTRLLRVGGHPAVVHLYKQTPQDLPLGVDARFHQMILVNYPAHIGFIWSEFMIEDLRIDDEERIIAGDQPEIAQGLDLLATLRPGG